MNYHQICSKESGCSWEESKEVCEKEDGYLVKITSKEENDKILEIINDTGNAVQRRKFWLGLNDIENEGDFRWISDNSVKGYDNFDSGKSYN